MVLQELLQAFMESPGRICPGAMAVGGDGHSRGWQCHQSPLGQWLCVTEAADDWSEEPYPFVGAALPFWDCCQSCPSVI